MRSVVPIRFVTPADTAEVVRLAAQWGYPTSEQVMRRRLDLLLSSPRHVALVAGAEGALLGWGTGEVRLSLGSDPRVEITGLVVDAAARRSGVGSLLVAAIERWALENGFHEIFLRTNVARAESHPFYERLGFELSKTQHAYKKVLHAA
jgi:GNAT superfamily N-acetyltransferase